MNRATSCPTCELLASIANRTKHVGSSRGGSDSEAQIGSVAGYDPLERTQSPGFRDRPDGTILISPGYISTGENSRTKVQNVVTNSTAKMLRLSAI